MKGTKEIRNGALPIPLACALVVLLGVLLAGCGGEGGGAQQERGGDRDAPPALGKGTWPVAEVAAEVEPSVVQVNVRAIQETPLG